MAYKGKYTPKNPSKYIGNPTKVIYRSLWERKMMNWMDNNPSVLRWGSEETIVMYVSPVDGKRHRYYVDFIMEVQNKNKEIQTFLIEVKPKKQTKPPVKPKKKTKTFINEAKTYSVNKAKWDAAEKVCEARGWKFMIVTEDTLFKKETDG